MYTHNLLLFALYLPLFFQVPGSVTVVKPTTITATTTNLRCTLQTNDGGLHVSTYCYVGTALVFNATATIVGITDKPNAALVHYGYLGDAVTGMFWRPASGASIQWQVAANGVMKEGVF